MRYSNKINQLKSLLNVSRFNLVRVYDDRACDILAKKLGSLADDLKNRGQEIRDCPHRVDPLEVQKQRMQGLAFVSAAVMRHGMNEQHAIDMAIDRYRLIGTGFMVTAPDYLKKLRKRRIKARNERVVHALKKGVSTAKIARREHIAKHIIHYIRQKEQNHARKEDTHSTLTPCKLESSATSRQKNTIPHQPSCD